MDHAFHSPDTLTVPVESKKPITAYNLETNSHTFGNVKVTVTKGPMLSSQCQCSSLKTNPEEIAGGDGEQRCVFCRYEPKITLKHLPDMVFVQNRLVVAFFWGKFGIEFNAVDAVNSIRDTPTTDARVASAEVWQAARSESLKTHTTHAVQYDWTYTPHYRGTIFGQGLKVEPTDLQLDMNLLTKKDPVMFFDELQLYGDELDDNGCAELEIKIRIVESYMFILLRFYLRVDHVMVRIQDTRLFLEKDKPYMLREFSVRESSISNLPSNVSPMDASAVWQALQPQQVVVEKITFS
ncbi:hypothetical protein RvY_18559 [Ramazzottius varieornatus]|uniref:TIP41-like protein n=1 Tax=Ramazzottius varieornatus TaxID=947166 RepID=A0A1D1W676_RAMVA|nr:hypothetical protein RvY_18559 [Ramazzottius varieornatus]